MANRKTSHAAERKKDWDRKHPNLTHTAWAAIKKARRMEKVRAHLAGVALIPNPAKCHHCKKTFNAATLEKRLCMRCALKRQVKMRLKAQAQTPYKEIKNVSHP